MFPTDFINWTHFWHKLPDASKMSKWNWKRKR